MTSALASERSLLTMTVVATMTWLVAPALTRLFKPWLSPGSSVSRGKR